MKKYILLIIMIMFASCKKSYIAEIEPNNDFSSATPAELNREVRGYLDSASDTDFYQLISSEDTLVSLELSAVKGVNHSVEVFFDDGGQVRPVKLIDDVRKSSAEKMPNLFLQSGRYYFKISYGDRDDAEGNKDAYYVLKLTSGEYISSEKEGNDDFNSATAIEQGETFSGYYYPAFNKLNRRKDSELKEEDYYAVQVDCSAENPVLLDVSVTGVENVDSVLNLYDPFQVLIATANNNGSGQGENFSDIGLTKPGKYYVSVSSVNFEVNFDVKYQIQMMVKPYDTSIEMESNNDYQRANRIIDNVINGKIFPAGDSDFFEINSGGSDGMFRIEVIPPVGMDIKLELLDESGETLAEADNFKDGEKEIFPNFYSESRFYLKVTSSGSYADAEMGYAVSVNESKKDPTEEIEPNDSVSSANKVKTRIIKGYISSNNDKDYFLIDPGSRVKVKFSVSGIDGTEFDFSISDSLGYAIKTETINGTDVKVIEEMIDSRGYIVIESKGDVSNFPYSIEIGD
ncbi:MAG: hypothetical protein JW982_13090 [Spirochaetes bacterium]|nr:hypothetical protein [Spirochaetota bacterium]